MNSDNNIAIISKCLVLFLLAIGIVSCNDEKNGSLFNYELVIPESAYSLTVSTVNNEGETIVYAEPSFTDNFEKLGCQVKSVMYYVDDMFVSKETEAPYKMEYRTSSLLPGIHHVKMVFTVGGEGFQDAITEHTEEFLIRSNSSNRPEIKFNVDYEHFLRVGEKLHVSVNMTDVYNLRYQVNEVKVFFNGEKIYTGTNIPFNFDYSPSLTIGQSYAFKIEISYYLEAPTYTAGSYSFVSNINAIADDETVYIFSPGFSQSTHFVNDDIISGKGLLYKGVGDNKVYELNMYWDDVLIGTSRSFPYEFSYKVQNCSPGIHTLKNEWKRYAMDGITLEASQSRSTTITVDE